MTTLNPKLAQRRFVHLLETFVVSEQRAELLQSPRGVHTTLERALMPELSVVPAPKDVVAWLCANEPSAWIARFDPRHAAALELFASSVQNEWLSSWPGIYLSNDGKRLLCVSVDYERSLCDASPRATPYR